MSTRKKRKNTADVHRCDRESQHHGQRGSRGKWSEEKESSQYGCFDEDKKRKRAHLSATVLTEKTVTVRENMVRRNST